MESTPSRLVASCLALAFVSTKMDPNLRTALLSAGAAALILIKLALLPAFTKKPAKAHGFSLQLGFAWAVRIAGASWASAGLAAGLLTGLTGRASREAAGGRGKGATASPARRLHESGMVLAFAAGMGLSIDTLSSSIPMTILMAAAFVAASLSGGLIAGRGTVMLPTEAFALAALLAARRAGLSVDPAIAGAALALTLAAPFNRRSGETGRLADGPEPYKAIVGVSRSDGSACAVEFAAALGADTEPVRAVCVAVPPGATGLGPAEAEDALVHCVLAGTAAGLRILPSVLVATTVAEGLARAASERHADVVVVGSTGRTGTAGESGSNLSRLLSAYPDSIVSIRKPERFPSSKRIVVVAIAGAGMGNDFYRAISAIHRAWGNRSRTMDALMVGAESSVLVDATHGLIPPRATKSLSSWRDAPATLGTASSSDTAFVIFVARPGSPAWNPGHDRLPVVLAGAYPESAIALWFTPAENSPPPTQEELAQPDSPEVESGQESAGTPPLKPPAPLEAERWPPLLSSAYESGRVLVNLDEPAIVDAIRRLTTTIFPQDRKLAGSLATDFSAIARKEPIELAPGILLLHGHAKGPAIPVLAVGANKAGWPLVALQSPVRIVVVLVSPDEAGPESHLEALTQIALAFRNLKLAEHLLADPPA
jgi:nucleotide-binding universal stress UspA family protein